MNGDNILLISADVLFCQFQKLLSENKETDKSNAYWFENQNWTEFAAKDLPALETKMLKLEAELARKLKECKEIKKSVENEE